MSTKTDLNPKHNPKSIKTNPLQYLTLINNSQNPFSKL